jgi:acetoin utilization deacetylase AcuC-like enzyme
MSRMLTIEQRTGARAVQPWLLSRSGERLRGHDHDLRLCELRTGLLRHPRVRLAQASASGEEVERSLAALHAPEYIRALARVRSEQPTLMGDFAAPGMAPDTPVCAGIARAAYEAVRTSIAAATSIVAGERFAYALCRPPGHHAGPAWLGGCCFFNNAAAAARTLLAGGFGPVAIVDLDIHYPNGTAAIAARMRDTTVYSLHAWPVVNVASQTAEPGGEHERVVEFREAPSPTRYLEAVAGTVQALSRSAGAIVLSLGYDTLAGDPHGSWSFPPSIFASIGSLFADSGLPVCVVQEGGYALDALPRCGYEFARGLLGDRET